MTICGHTDHHHHAADVLQVARAQCDARGLRLTPLRERVLELIAEHHGPAKAYDLLDALKRSHASAAPPTVYRAIDFLVDAGFVHKVESLNAYVACPHPGGLHSAQFLICDRCGSAIEIDGESLPELLTSIALAQNFVAKKLVVEVHGDCQSCLTLK
jgi:Fur family transcriptional regulator, zinc uptake regulator